MRRSIKSLIVTTCLASALAVGPAHAVAPNSWYAGLSGDATWFNHSNTGGGGNVALGYRFSDFRLEGEAGYHLAGGDSGYRDSHYYTYMGNLYYDFNRVFPASASGWHVVPYIGAGAGDAMVHYGSNPSAGVLPSAKNDFAYEGMAGFALASVSGPDWYLGYRYTGTGSDNLHASNAELGVRFHF